MANPICITQSKARLVALFLVIFLPMLMLACNIMNYDAENEMLTPKPDIRNGVVMTGTATIVRYWGQTCTNSGTAVLTINPDATFILKTDLPDISPKDCSTTGDRLSDRVTGKYFYEDGGLYFKLCDADLTTQSVGWVTDKEGQGDVVCYDNFNGKAEKFLLISFDVKK